jgi:hypothetical protein
LSSDTTSHDFGWSIYHLPTDQVQEGDVKSTWVFGQDNIYFNNTYLYRFDGSAIHKLFLWTSEGGELKYIGGSRLFCFDTADFWLFGGSIIDHVDGRRYQGELVAWTTRLNEIGVGGTATAAWGTSSKDMFFVGDGGNILHFDGTTWIKYPKVTDVPLTSVWGTSHSDVWACGYDQTLSTTCLLHFDGNQWSRDSLGDVSPHSTGGMVTVWASDSAGHRIAKVAGSLVFERTDENSWRRSASLDGSKRETMYLSAGNSSNDYLGVGGWGYAEHWNGRSWHLYSELFDEGAPDFIPHVAHMHGNTACIVGRKNGNSWIAIGQR